MKLTLSKMRERFDSGENPIVLSKDEFSQYIELITPAVPFNPIAWKTEEKKMLDNGVAYFRARKVSRKI